MFDRLIPQSVLPSLAASKVASDPTSDQPEAPSPTRRSVLLAGLGALASTTLFSGCENRSFIHDPRYTPLVGVTQKLQMMDHDGSLDSASQRELEQFADRLEKLNSDDRPSFGSIHDPELTRQIDRLITDLAKVNQKDATQVSELLKRAQDALELLCEDETHPEMREGMR